MCRYTHAMLRCTYTASEEMEVDSVRTIARVPNQPKTPHRSVRVDDDDWSDLDAAASARSLTGRS